MTFRLRHDAMVVMALATLVLASAAAAQQSNREEAAAKLKTAYLVNFIKFTTWPEDALAEADDLIVITIVGSSLIEAQLQQLEGQKIQGRRLEVRRETYPASDADEETRSDFATRLQESHVVFVAASANRHAADIIESIDGEPVLTVGDGSGFAREGGMLGLRQTNDGRIAFDANVDAIKETRVEVSSQVLRLATIVKSREQ